MSAAPPGGFTIANAKVIASGALAMVVDVTMPSGMVLHRVSIFRKDGRTWAAPPSKQIIGRDGTVQRDAAGRVRYEPVVSFQNRAASEAWGSAVMEAIRRTELDAAP